MSINIKAKTISSLEKVFWDEELKATECSSFSALRGENLSFQVAVYFSVDDESQFLKPLNENLKIMAEVGASFSADIEIREVALVAVNHPVMEIHDDDYLRTTPGLYPDILYSHTGSWSVGRNQWRCLWVSVDISEEASQGEQKITINLFNNRDNSLLLTKEVIINVIPAVLPEQSLIFSQWIHLDCLASHYNVPIFSREHWTLIGNYIKHAAENGINLLLTPVFTPPLDTAIGSERPTVQLIDVFITQQGYRFDFVKLDKYMELAEACGIYRFEISHLYTQWGAKYAPKVVAYENGEEIMLFGWDTDAVSKEYGGFLRTFLRELKKHLSALNRLENCWFHISDEPELKMFENYNKAYQAISEELEGCKIIDALSDYNFYKKGYKGCPIASLDVLDVFIENGVTDIWTYYCSGQGTDVSNRFIAMPSYRNRILGYQLYKYDIKGFLQWGYNFWYSFLSKEQVNPFFETGGLDALPAGDAFSVYPGKDGNPISSIREVVFFETLQDMRALQLLENLIGRENTMEILESENTLTVKSYERCPEWILSKRQEINNAILNALHIKKIEKLRVMK